MAQTSKGILGNVSGTVGTVVGAKWRGKSYLRSKPDIKKSGKKSDRQLIQQAKFALANNLSQGMKELLDIGFKTTATGLTGKNKALSHMLKKAITGTYPDLQIAYNRVMVSKGTLLNAFDAKASVAVKEAIQFTWTDNSTVSNTNETDVVLMAAYCPDFNCTVFRTGNNRKTANDTLQMPGFTGKLVHTWVTFITEDGEDIATSLYTGEVIIT
ncbi:hypothetical protein A3860_38055 [Niastella vici]|uniref:Uncharacterized protein n=1 Tax=Niastella vici TaxID=1703345 RepID=A0A1V9FLU3_9BACT|nr:DUF6266 family protein [Niastella vici]OQP59261.1 hypothetical protein A3860_38055 [Niastella vici]